MIVILEYFDHLLISMIWTHMQNKLIYIFYLKTSHLCIKSILSMAIMPHGQGLINEHIRSNMYKFKI